MKREVPKDEKATALDTAGNPFCLLCGNIRIRTLLAVPPFFIQPTFGVRARGVLLLYVYSRR